MDKNIGKTDNELSPTLALLIIFGLLIITNYIMDYFDLLPEQNPACKVINCTVHPDATVCPDGGVASNPLSCGITKGGNVFDGQWRCDQNRFSGKYEYVEHFPRDEHPSIEKVVENGGECLKSKKIPHFECVVWTNRSLEECEYLACEIARYPVMQCSEWVWAKNT